MYISITQQKMTHSGDAKRSDGMLEFPLSHFTLLGTKYIQRWTHGNHGFLLLIGSPL